MNKYLAHQVLVSSGWDYRNHFLLFMLWPFLSLVVALANYSQKESKRIVYIFLIYYGLTFIVTQTGMDAFRYAQRFHINSNLPFSDFYEIVGGIYATSTSIDIIEPFISFVVSRFTSNHNILFASYAAFFGFFYLKSINLLYKHYKESPGWNSLIFMFLFIIIIPITSINAPRMWVAAWIFFYGAYHVIVFRDIKYLLVTLLACFMHWSFFIPSAILMIYYFIGNRNLIYLPIVFVSFIFPNLLFSVFESIASMLGGAFETRFRGYTNEGYNLWVQESLEQAKWFVELSKNLIFYYLIIIIIIINFFQYGLMKNMREKNLFSFLLLFLAFVNFAKPIPAFGERFQIVFNLFATLYVFWYFLKLPGDKISFITVAGLFPMALFAAFEFRIGSESINPWIFAPGFGLPFIVEELSLAELFFNK